MYSFFLNSFFRRHLTAFNSSCQIKLKQSVEKTDDNKQTQQKQTQFNNNISLYDMSLMFNKENSAECVAKNLPKCRKAIIALRGNYLEAPCYCENRDKNCLKKFYFIMPNNPCLGKDDFYSFKRGKVETRILSFT